MKAIFLLVAFWVFSVLGTAAARADTVDIVVDAFAIAGHAVGVSIGDSEKSIVKALVRCTVVERQPLLSCARNALSEPLLRQVPREVREVVRCLALGTAPERCATGEVLRRLPQQARGLAECIGTRQDIGHCGRQFATQGALKQTFEIIDRLKVDAVSRNPMSQHGRSIQNILCTTQAVDRNDWAKVLECGGREVAKAATKIILQAAVPGLATVLQPAVDGMIERRIDFVTEVMKASRPPNTRRLAELAAEAFILFDTPLGQSVTLVCDLVPDGAVKEFTCGPIGDAIRSVTRIGGGVVEAVTDLPGEIVGAITGSGCDFDASGYYRDTFPACYRQGIALSDGHDEKYIRFVGHLYQTCRRHFEDQYSRGLLGRSTTSCLNSVCNPLRDQFQTQVSEHWRTLDHTAVAFAGAYPQVLYREKDDRGRWVCDPAPYQAQFQSDCRSILERRFPYLGRTPAGYCNVGGLTNWDVQPSDPFIATCSGRNTAIAELRMIRNCQCPPGTRDAPNNPATSRCVPLAATSAVPANIGYILKHRPVRASNSLPAQLNYVLRN